MTSHPFDIATAVSRRDDGSFTARTSADYRTFVGQFGGTTAATLLRALLAHPEHRGEPVALTVNFAAPLEAEAYRIDTRLVRANRSTQYWSLDVLQGDDPAPCANATAILAERRPTWSHHSASPPAPRPRETLTQHDAGATVPWVYRYRFHFDAGAPVRAEAPLSPSAPAFSQLWLSDAQERVVDVFSLASMADAFFGRIFHVRGVIVPFGTVSMTTYFHADSQELAGLATSSLIGRVDARRFHRSFGDQTGELWSPDGRLLATTHQIAYFKA